MENILFSHYSFGRLVPALLASVIAFYLYRQNRTSLSSSRTFFFFLYFLSASIFNISFFFAYSVYNEYGAYFWYFAAIAPFGISFLIQFAYRYPEKAFPVESAGALAVTLSLSAASFIHFVYVSIRGDIRITITDYELSYDSAAIAVTCLIFFLWAIIVFLRQSVRISRSNNNDKKAAALLLRPSNPEALAARNFALIVVLELINSLLVTVFMYSGIIPVTDINMMMNIILFTAYVLYIILFINSSGEPMMIADKISGALMVMALFILLVSGYYILSIRDATYDDYNHLLVEHLKQDIISEKKHNFPEEIAYAGHKSPDGEYSFFYPETDPPAIKPGMAVRYRSSFASGSGPDHPPVDKLFGRRFYVNTVNSHFFHYYADCGESLCVLGLSVAHYRSYIHKTASICIAGTIIIFILSIITARFILSRGIMKPLRNLLDLVSPSAVKTGTVNDELEYITGLVRETVKLNRKLRSEIKNLKNSLIEKHKKSRKNVPLSPTVEKKILNVIAFLEENYRYDISREGVAARFDLNLSKLSVSFNQYTGMKIGDFINELRIKDAMVQLETTDRLVIEIAFSVGFESLRTFNRSFYKINGITPTEFRSRSAGG